MFRQRLPRISVLAVAVVAAVGVLLASGSSTSVPRAVTLTAISEEATSAPAEPAAKDIVPVRKIIRVPAAADRPQAPPAADRPQAPPPLPVPEYAFIWPASGSISQGMTARHPRGLDIAAGPGDFVNAVRGGEVIAAGGDPCCVYGLHVIVQHDEGWSSLYAHLNALLVEPGDRVEQGDPLGPAGDTGRAGGVHLHFELLSFGAPVNPLDQLQPLRSYTSPVEPIEEPANVDEPEPTDEPGPAVKDPEPVDESAGRAIRLASRWIARQGEGNYEVHYDSCFAISSGPNWSVSCSVVPWGCEGATCTRQMEACVFGSSRLVEAICSGY